ncbi:MAG: ATP-binding cassette domain-containing protein [Burkholderia sp.]|jgi:putative ATP-binding cassette transporter|uniref:ABC transporter ATP-binding protein/permease n=1 Tax=Burkholderia sp. TaxID=36773 RepID=UPI00282936AC|nr:ATP-binding cassette domain-containing protein [Burkholderia sp.]MDR0245593.1 ATP-binding cassette domain-containing protein [Burkholderia sp.]
MTLPIWTAKAGVDADDLRINRRFFRRLTRLTLPYWTRPGAWRAWLLLAGLLLVTVAIVGVAAWISYLAKDTTNALVNKQHDQYWRLFTLSTIAGAALFVTLTTSHYLQQRLELCWRRWLTGDLVSRYLSQRTYYEIARTQSLDNVDQRLQGEVGPLVQILLKQPALLLQSISSLGVQAAILFTIAPLVFWAALGYGLFSALLTYWLYPPTIRQNFDITVAEADLRYGLLHVRDHAEIIAFYRGEQVERDSILARLDWAIRRTLVNIHYQLMMQGVLYGVSIFWIVAPTALLVPLYFSGRIEFGQIAQATLAAGTILAAIEGITKFLPQIAAAAPHVVRLAQIVEQYESIGSARKEDPRQHIRLANVSGCEAITVEDLSIWTPGGERKLVHDLSLRIGNGDHWAIVGQTGVGKSSLLRALAGLWDRGSGRLKMPSADQLLFLPQRPYMLLGTLRAQLLYPNLDSGQTDEALQTILERVKLPQLARLHDGFDSVKDWSRILSLGEQQRIAFARVLIARPSFVFLDEATSAVDVQTEHDLYALLASIGVTYISVGHRPSMMRFHPHTLGLLPNGDWKVSSTGEAHGPLWPPHHDSPGSAPQSGRSIES